MEYDEDVTPVHVSRAVVGGHALGQPYKGETGRQETTLERLTGRINSLQQTASEICVNLRVHADGLHGEQPTNAEPTKPSPVRSGQIGALEDAIDRLEDTLSYVAAEASRNCTLA